MSRMLLPLPAAVLVLFSASGVAPLWLTVPLGLCAALVAPGVALVDLVAPARLREATALVLVPAVSLGALVLGGLLLDVLPWGLSRGAWAAGLLVLTTAAVAASAVRARDVVRPTGSAGLPLVPAPAPVLKAVGCAALVAVAVGLAVVSSQRLDDRQHLTELWLAPVGTAAQAVHLRNDEGRDTAYVVEVQVGEQPATSTSVQVRDGATWSRPLPDAGVGQRVVVEVRRPGDPQPYRRVAVGAAG